MIEENKNGEESPGDGKTGSREEEKTESQKDQSASKPIIIQNEKNTKPEDSLTPNKKQETNSHEPVTEKEMEVHHHSHVHGKKNWKTYFWEFLMLFLAVFCGFLAEYQLEHKIEKDRELQYIKSLGFDLQDDIKNLDAMITVDTAGIAKVDTLMELLNNPQQAKQNGAQLYYVARLGPCEQPFANNSRTFDQLKHGDNPMM